MTQTKIDDYQSFFEKSITHEKEEIEWIYIWFDLIYTNYSWQGHSEYAYQW
jgi:hypothetical protein